MLHGQGKKVQSFIFNAFLVQSFPLSCLYNTEWTGDLAIIWYNLIKIDGKSNNARHKVTWGRFHLCWWYNCQITTLISPEFLSPLMEPAVLSFWIVLLPFSHSTEFWSIGLIFSFSGYISVLKYIMTNIKTRQSLYLKWMFSLITSERGGDKCKR